MKTLKCIAVLLALVFFGCKKNNVEPTQSITKDRISGNTQKGPFVNGSTLTIYELNASFAQTGKSFNTQIIDNTGLFEFANISLVTQYAKLKADGFYYNEVTDKTSLAQITLYALSDVSNKNTFNVNLMTTLESSRVEYLISNGLTFSDAKKQAQSEILNIFSITKSNILESELLNISQNGDDNAVLLAVSVIVQGFRTDAQITQLIGDIVSDIRTDGILNNQTLGTQMINDVRLMNLAEIRSHIENKYQSLGVNATIPNFEKYIHNFVDSTNYNFTNIIEYPGFYSVRQNLIYDSVFNVISGFDYSLSAYLPLGTSLKILIKPTAGSNWNTGQVGYHPLDNQGWTIENYYPDSMIFKASGNNQTVDVPFTFSGPPMSSSTDFFIFENGSSIPLRVSTRTN